MRKLFCDCCKKEVKQLNKIKFKTHIKSIVKSGVNLCGYVDNEGNPASGRIKEIEVCNSCYNEIMYEMYKKFEEKKEYKMRSDNYS
ncbi:MAG: hypothetical protein ACOCRO_07535 [Halanaerobiales bacterium]